MGDPPELTESGESPESMGIRGFSAVLLIGAGCAVALSRWRPSVSSSTRDRRRPVPAVAGRWGRAEIAANGQDPDAMLANAITNEPGAAVRAARLVASALRIAAET